MNPVRPNRHTRRAAAAAAPAAEPVVAPAVDPTVAIEPAIAASAERAAIERDPAIEAAAPPAIDPLVPAIDPPEPAAVLPEPTLVAEPDAPQPIVTASPILAVEPSALDVVKADAAADRVAAGMEPEADREGPHGAAAGQPTLTIEGSAADRVAHQLADGALGDVSDLGRQVLDGWNGRDPLDELLDDLRIIMVEDADACARVLDVLLPLAQPARIAPGPIDTLAATIAVVEVVGPPAGRRRAGMTFGPTPRRFRLDSLSEGALEALRGDPLLAVGVSEMDEEDALALFALG